MKGSSLRKDPENFEQLISQEQEDEITQVQVDAENEGRDHHHSRGVDDLRLGRPGHLLGFDHDFREKDF
jgi:hypothetical protein